MSLTLVLTALVRVKVSVRVRGRGRGRGWGRVRIQVRARGRGRGRVAVSVLTLARCAKRRVVWHSSMFSSSVRSVTTMLALQLPPRLSCSRRVSFESRQGMCALCPALESFSMTEPSE